MMRVVVVDDEPLARSGVAARLGEHEDIDVVGEYADATGAFAGIVKHRPDLAFVDVQMPGVNGLDMLAMLTADERPMAIMLTAYDSFAIRAFELRAIDYLLKPIDDTRLPRRSIARDRRCHIVVRTRGPNRGWKIHPSWSVLRCVSG